MKRIKVDKEIVDQFVHLDEEIISLRMMNARVGRQYNKVWERLKLEYPDSDFTCATVDTEKKLLILPFELSSPLLVNQSESEDEPE